MGFPQFPFSGRDGPAGPGNVKTVPLEPFLGTAFHAGPDEQARAVPAGFRPTVENASRRLDPNFHRGPGRAAGGPRPPGLPTPSAFAGAAGRPGPLSLLGLGR